jgi:hypothetical protein
VELEHLDKQFGKQPVWETVSEITSMVFGAEPITKKLMCPYLRVNKAMIDGIPRQHHFNVSSVIMSCGDFQIAKKDTWYTIRGFEESMIKRNYADTCVQSKVIHAGGTVRATNFPPVYHIEHYRDTNSAIMNDEILCTHTQNLDTWGFSDSLEHQGV